MPGADARLQSWGGLAPLRIVVAPLFALMFFVSALFAPARGFRVALLVAAWSRPRSACSSRFRGSIRSRLDDGGGALARPPSASLSSAVEREAVRVAGRHSPVGLRPPVMPRVAAAPARKARTRRLRFEGTTH